MAIGLGLGYSCHPHLRLNSSLLRRVSTVRFSCAAAIETVDGPDGFSRDPGTYNEGGFDVYLVGGCVHDLLLKRTPKDFDMLTTAELKEVMKAFSWCEIVGKRFPICHVHIGDDVVEVSSFSTSARNRSVDPGLTFHQHDGIDENNHNRWRNCMQRDLTINGFLLWPWEPKSSMALFPLLSRID